MTNITANGNSAEQTESSNKKAYLLFSGTFDGATIAVEVQTPGASAAWVPVGEVTEPGGLEVTCGAQPYRFATTGAGAGTDVNAEAIKVW